MPRATQTSPAEFHVLLALADGTKHGHAIKLDVRDRTDGRVDMGPGTLYGAMKRLLERGLIREVTKEAGREPIDERRRYYAATSEGLDVARAEAERLAALVGIAAAKALIQP